MTRKRITGEQAGMVALAEMLRDRPVWYNCGPVQFNRKNGCVESMWISQSMDQVLDWTDCEIEVDEPAPQQQDRSVVPVEMTAKEALRWMIEHEGQEIESKPTSDVYRYEFGSHGIRHRIVDCPGGWCETSLVWFMRNGPYRIAPKPARKMPELPEGSRWDRSLGAIWTNSGESWRVARNKFERDLSAALVQEFDTRPTQDPQPIYDDDGMGHAVRGEK